MHLNKYISIHRTSLEGAQEMVTVIIWWGGGGGSGGERMETRMGRKECFYSFTLHSLALMEYFLLCACIIQENIYKEQSVTTQEKNILTLFT